MPLACGCAGSGPHPVWAKLADLVACPADPLTMTPDDLADLTPAFTIVGGRAVHDPGSRLASWTPESLMR